VGCRAKIIRGLLGHPGSQQLGKNMAGCVASDGLVEIKGWGISRLHGSRYRLRQRVRAKVMRRLLGRPRSQQLEGMVEILDEGILRLHGSQYPLWSGEGQVRK